MTALMTRSRASPLDCEIRCGNADGTTCQDNPYLSLSQPQGPSWPPSLSFSQKWSISSWLSRMTWNEIASENLNCGPPLSAVKVLFFEFERDHHDRPRLLAVHILAGVAVAADLFDPRIGEDGRVEIRCFFGLSVEPQTRCHLLGEARHGNSFHEAAAPLFRAGEVSLESLNVPPQPPRMLSRAASKVCRSSSVALSGDQTSVTLVLPPGCSSKVTVVSS